MIDNPDRTRLAIVFSGHCTQLHTRNISGGVNVWHTNAVESIVIDMDNVEHSLVDVVESGARVHNKIDNSKKNSIHSDRQDVVENCCSKCNTPPHTHTERER